MSDSGSAQDGKVGYKRPPTQIRFQKGQSGNPRGRQNGVRNFAWTSSVRLKSRSP
jgi:Family of unknown function (DUF5681)